MANPEGDLASVLTPAIPAAPGDPAIPEVADDVERIED